MKKFTLTLMLISIFSLLFITACKDKKATKEKAAKTAEIKKETPKPAVKVEPKPEPEPVAKPVVKKIIVKEGEWLYNISRREYGTSQGWIKIYNANKALIKDPDLIFPNQELVIPE
ncbi:MAG: LysM peptidoglycan-binding domain-containing protein [Bacteroidales bacterium]|nr:LysM peptidoglycan-binding domain-containing protein [Bacteroidales bacterium]